MGGEEVRKQVGHLLVGQLRGEVLGHQRFAGARQFLDLAAQDGVLGPSARRSVSDEGVSEAIRPEKTRPLRSLTKYWT